MAWIHPTDVSWPGASRIFSCSRDFVGIRARTTLRCINNKGSSSNRKEEPRTSKGKSSSGFAGLVTQLQQQQQNSKAANRNASNAIEGLKTAFEQQKKSNSTKKISTASDLKRYLVAPASTPDSKSDAKASNLEQKNEAESHKKSQEGFSEAVMAAWRQAALEQKQKEITKNQRKRNKNRRPATADPQEEIKQTPLPAEAKQIVLKPEWAAKIRQLEEQLESLKQEYYKKF